MSFSSTIKLLLVQQNSLRQRVEETFIHSHNKKIWSKIYDIGEKSLYYNNGEIFGSIAFRRFVLLGHRTSQFRTFGNGTSGESVICPGGCTKPCNSLMYAASATRDQWITMCPATTPPVSYRSSQILCYLLYRHVRRISSVKSLPLTYSWHKLYTFSYELSTSLHYSKCITLIYLNYYTKWIRK